MSIRNTHHQGFSLIEILIALVILSVALLGLAQNQIRALKTNNSALLRSEAIEYANDIADRIRGNGEGEAAYNLTMGDTPPTSVKNCITESTSSNGATCTAAEMAAFDLAQWYCSLQGDVQSTGCKNVMLVANRAGMVSADGLPNGQASIVWNASRQEYAITVQWLEDNANNTNGSIFLEVSPWRR